MKLESSVFTTITCSSIKLRNLILFEQMLGASHDALACVYHWSAFQGCHVQTLASWNSKYLTDTRMISSCWHCTTQQRLASSWLVCQLPLEGPGCLDNQCCKWTSHHQGPKKRILVPKNSFPTNLTASAATNVRTPDMKSAWRTTYCHGHCTFTFKCERKNCRVQLFCLHTAWLRDPRSPPPCMFSIFRYTRRSLRPC